MNARQTLAQIHYYREYQRFLSSLTDEDHMESTRQATQRLITLDSFQLVKKPLPQVHIFNELLVQYPIVGQRPTGKVVPDNMIVLHDGPLEVDGSYDIPFQPAGPFWTMEYVSKSSGRKDYDTNLEKYERALRVPYYLLFEPDAVEMTLYQMNDQDRYVTVKPDAHDRYPIPELNMEIGLLDNWVRYWFQGELLPLPGDLFTQLQTTRQALTQAREAIHQEQQARLIAEAEITRLRAELERSRGS